MMKSWLDFGDLALLSRSQLSKIAQIRAFVVGTSDSVFSENNTTVNYLKFLTLFSFFSQIKCWFSGLELKIACQNIKGGRP